MGAGSRRAVPAEADHTLVHGDYRLDNCVVSEDGHVAAVLDWEMATLGDPLADVGSQYMYWPEPGGAGASPAGGVSSGPVLSLPGFPTRSEALARYAEKSGRDVSQLDFYAALAFFRLAVILEGIHARYPGGGNRRGGVRDDGGAGAGAHAAGAGGHGAFVDRGVAGVGRRRGAHHLSHRVGAIVRRSGSPRPLARRSANRGRLRTALPTR